MPVELYHHPFTRASTVVPMLEAAGCDYTLRYVDLLAGEQKTDAIVALNPMGKLPILVDDGTVVTETAAIGLYLADKYAPGELAPAIDDPARGPYLRWSFFAPSVIEPGTGNESGGWETNRGSVGWGTYAAMLRAIESAIGAGPWLLGERFSMADIVFGGTVRFMLGFKMLEPRPAFVDYAARLSAHPAVQRGDAVNARIIEERGLHRG